MVAGWGFTCPCPGERGEEGWGMPKKDRERERETVLVRQAGQLNVSERFQQHQA